MIVTLLSTSLHYYLSTDFDAVKIFISLFFDIVIFQIFIYCASKINTERRKYIYLYNLCNLRKNQQSNYRVKKKKSRKNVPQRHESTKR